MCLITFAWDTHPQYRLVLAANRDELHGRPTEEMHWWPDRPDVLAGRDLQAGGTWLAVSRQGRFATVTNYREHQQKPPGLESRGALVTDFVASDVPAAGFVAALDGDRYAGFSLLAGAGGELWYVSNRGDGPVRLEPGVYGLSNASLDNPWWKLVRAREGLRDLVTADNVNETALLRLLDDRTAAPAKTIEPGQLPFDIARAESAPFIVNDTYGTRCTTTLTWSDDEDVAVTEARFGAGGKRAGQSSFRFRVGQ
jgi:uncharacterized protein with NRDE domain